MRYSILGLGLCALGLAGCQNAIVGKWESDGNYPGATAGGELDIEDDALDGNGELTLPDDHSNFDTCAFDVAAKDQGGDEYELEIHFDTCTYGNSNRIELECKLDGDKLSCDPKDAALADILRHYEDWERQD